jgi:hypothetical protein
VGGSSHNQQNVKILQFDTLQKEKWEKFSMGWRYAQN